MAGKHQHGDHGHGLEMFNRNPLKCLMPQRLKICSLRRKISFSPASGQWALPGSGKGKELWTSPALLREGSLHPLPSGTHGVILSPSSQETEGKSFLPATLSVITVSCIEKVQSKLKTGHHYRTVELSLFNLPCRYKTRKHCWSVSFVKLNNTLLWQSEQSLQLGCWWGFFSVFNLRKLSS